MKANQIGNINEAILVLRHFIELSASLLSILDELERKKNPTRKELEDKNKIIDVYENYHFDTRTSKILLNSDVLELIQKSFKDISSTSFFLKPGVKNKTLELFLAEHDRLTKNWHVIDSN